jgi:hypothetical protein
MIHLPHAKGITRRSRPEPAESYFRSSALACPSATHLRQVGFEPNRELNPSPSAKLLFNYWHILPLTGNSFGVRGLCKERLYFGERLETTNTSAPSP